MLGFAAILHGRAAAQDMYSSFPCECANSYLLLVLLVLLLVLLVLSLLLLMMIANR